MPDVSDISAMCKAGKVQEAYELAKANMESMPTYPWVQKEVGWALYYKIKSDVETGDYNRLLEHLDELRSLNLLTIDNGRMIFDNVQSKIANFIKNHRFSDNAEAHAKLSTLFLKLNNYKFSASIGHSKLLRNYLKYKEWPELADFIDWWNLDNLTQEDYTPYVNQKGQRMMTLAERAFIANSKALLKLNDAVRIEEFLPKLDSLMTQHEEMMYPGYFYGKLLMALGSNVDEELRVIIPFARNKSTEFWVWQLLSDVFTNDEEKQLACLLRAVHCRTQENFLGKVRVKLATLYIKRGQLNAARFHIDAVTRYYIAQGWHLPHEVACWIRQPWIHSTIPDGKDPIDYMTITNDILSDGAEECIAIVTNMDQNSHKAYLIYDYEKLMVQRLRINVKVGDILKLYYTTDRSGRINVFYATKVKLPNDLNYAKCIDGIIEKRDYRDFAFLISGSIRSFVPPALVRKRNLRNGDMVKGLIIYDYNSTRDSWNWVCKKIIE